MKVHNFLQVVLLIVTLWNNVPSISQIIISISIYIGYIIYEQKTKVKIGGADIKIVCILLLAGISNVIYMLFWASLTGLLYALVTNKHKIPFVPFIWIGYTIVNI
ncbi:hypothetical protein RZE82_07705 [Mollicutes bacterium LVI A0039]|nr:hypothetical protein RZE82_07705 [Mollicutes bacterium LVI A0039]